MGNQYICEVCAKKYSENEAQGLNLKCNSSQNGKCLGDLIQMISSMTINEPIDNIDTKETIKKQKEEREKLKKEKVAEENIRQEEYKRAKIKAEAKAEELRNICVKFPVKVATTGKIFGTITTLDVARVLNDRGYKVDLKDISFTESISLIGLYTVNIKLHKDIIAKVNIEVVSDETIPKEENGKDHIAKKKVPHVVSKEQLHKNVKSAQEKLESERLTEEQEKREDEIIAHFNTLGKKSVNKQKKIIDDSNKGYVHLNDFLLLIKDKDFNKHNTEKLVITFLNDNDYTFIKDVNDISKRTVLNKGKIPKELYDKFKNNLNDIVTVYKNENFSIIFYANFQKYIEESYDKPSESKKILDFYLKTENEIFPIYDINPNIRYSLFIKFQKNYEEIIQQFEASKKRIKVKEYFTWLVIVLLLLTPLIYLYETNDDNKLEKEEGLTEESIDNKVYSSVKQMPQYPGGDKALKEYIKNTLVYPHSAISNGVSGTVYAQFVVNKNGSISDAKITKDIGEGCGDEALRIIRNMQAWTSGYYNGEKVRVLYTLPITFNYVYKDENKNPQEKKKLSSKTLLNNSFYLDNNGLIIDSKNNLMWLTKNIQKVNWDNAVINATKSTYAGYTDWRIPTIAELHTLVKYPNNNYQKGINPYFEKLSGFIENKSYWSYNTCVIEKGVMRCLVKYSNGNYKSDAAYAIGFKSGISGTHRKKANLPVFYVRSITKNKSSARNKTKIANIVISNPAYFTGKWDVHNENSKVAKYIFNSNKSGEFINSNSKVFPLKWWVEEINHKFTLNVVINNSTWKWNINKIQENKVEMYCSQRNIHRIIEKSIIQTSNIKIVKSNLIAEEEPLRQHNGLIKMYNYHFFNTEGHRRPVWDGKFIDLLLKNGITAEEFRKVGFRYTGKGLNFEYEGKVYSNRDLYRFLDIDALNKKISSLDEGLEGSVDDVKIKITEDKAKNNISYSTNLSEKYPYGKNKGKVVFYNLIKSNCELSMDGRLLTSFTKYYNKSDIRLWTLDMFEDHADNEALKGVICPIGKHQIEVKFQYGNSMVFDIIVLATICTTVRLGTEKFEYHDSSIDWKGFE